MLTNQLFEQHVTVRTTHQDHNEINRLLAAAVVSRQFRNLLLTNPAQAITMGYAGEHFSLSAEEYNLVLSAQATTLPEFAKQLCKHMPMPKPAAKPALSENYQLCM
jgi:hypothetical protein